MKIWYLQWVLSICALQRLHYCSQQVWLVFVCACSVCRKGIKVNVFIHLYKCCFHLLVWHQLFLNPLEMYCLFHVNATPAKYLDMYVTAQKHAGCTHCKLSLCLDICWSGAAVSFPARRKGSPDCQQAVFGTVLATSKKLWMLQRNVAAVPQRLGTGSSNNPYLKHRGVRGARFAFSSVLAACCVIPAGQCTAATWLTWLSRLQRGCGATCTSSVPPGWGVTCPAVWDIAARCGTAACSTFLCIPLSDVRL